MSGLASSPPWSVSWPGNRVRTMFLMLVVLAVALELAAGTGLAYVAGFSAMLTALSRVDWTWVAALCGALGVSFTGYYCAYRGIFTVAGGPAFPPRRLLTVAAVGFGGFLAHGAGPRVPDRLLGRPALPGPVPRANRVARGRRRLPGVGLPDQGAAALGVGLAGHGAVLGR